MLQIDSGRQGWKMTKILALIAVHVWKSRHRNNSDAFQNRLSGLNLTAEKTFDLKSAKTAKIHLPSRRLFPCPNGVPNGPIRKVSQRAPKVFKSIRVSSESCKVRFLPEGHNFRKSHFASRSLESLRDWLKSYPNLTKILKTHLEGFLPIEIHSKFDKSGRSAAANLKDP